MPKIVMLEKSSVDTALEILNESDVAQALEAVSDAIDCAETVETIEDFKANIDDAIKEARKLIEYLMAVREGV